MSSIRLELQNFFNNLQYRLEIFRESKKHTDLYLSSDFNVFDYISPDENSLSDIISDLLDPRGAHGQGNIFLKRFLYEIEVDADVDQKVELKREDTTRYIKSLFRRIDITIDFNNGQRAIGIENKPWAGEQVDQVKDYIEHLSKKYRGNFVLVYLSGNGTEPKSIGQASKSALMAEKKLKVIPYATKLMNWLEACLKDCQSEKVRWFLRDFNKYIDSNFQLYLGGEDEQ